MAAARPSAFLAHGWTWAIRPSALKSTGLLDDGATLWFSAVVGYGPESNYKWDRLSLALANNGFHQGNNSAWILDEGDQRGSGVGFTMAKHDASSIGGRVQATRFQDASLNTANSKPDIHGSWDGRPTLIPKGGCGLVVGRFTWADDGSSQPLKSLRKDIPGVTPGCGLDSGSASLRGR